jgi:putative transposase
VKQIYVESYFRSGYIRFMKYIYDIDSHPKKAEIERRLEIIKFFDEYGAAATKTAFRKGRSTVFLWKHVLNSTGGKLSALAPGNKAPIHRRKRRVDPFIEDFILKYRESHPGSDKTTITPVLAAACVSKGIKAVSESTVGRIIHDFKEKGRLPHFSKMAINGRSERLIAWAPKQLRKKTRRKGFQPQNPGDIVQMDTVSVFVEGIKRYIFTAIDVRTRFAFACAYKSNSSLNGSDFLQKCIQIAPFTTTRIQTDNGSEFEKYFDKTCQDRNLVHFFNYLRHPKSNSILERFNRTIQEQFVTWHFDEIIELTAFNLQLMQYLIWYNTEKPHRGIGKLPPLRYYLDNFVAPQKSNMLWTLTKI